MKMKQTHWTIPNILSVIRIFFLVPILIHLAAGHRTAAVLWMLGGALTDSLDGLIARRFNQCSDLGRILDPLMDKITVVTVMIYLIVNPDYFFPLGYAVFMVLREAMLLFGGMLILRSRSRVPESNRAGKNSAFANGLTVVLFVLNWQPYAWIALAGALILTLISTAGYIRSSLSIPPSETMEKTGV